MSCDLVVVTLFANGQVGLNDFRQRIESCHYILMKQDKLYVLGIRKLEFSDLECLPIHWEDAGIVQDSLYHWLRYIIWLRRRLNIIKPKRVVYLHSFLGFCGAFWGSRTYLYWNEHPEHFLPQSHKKYFKSLVLKFLNQKLYKYLARIDCIAPISTMMEDDLLLRGVSPERIRILPMGVESDWYDITLHRDRESPLQLVHFGSLREDRGMNLMLEMLDILRLKGVNVCLTWIGLTELSITARPDVQNWVRLGVLKIYPRLTGSQIRKICLSMHISICVWKPTKYRLYNPPTKLFESLAMGLPVLANQIRTHTEYLEDGVNAKICDYDATEMASAVIWFSEQTDRSLEMRKAARRAGLAWAWNNWKIQFEEDVWGSKTGESGTLV